MPAASVTIASTFVVAYGQLGTPEAFALGEREIQRIQAALGNAEPTYTHICPECRNTWESEYRFDDCPACDFTHWNNPTPVLAAVIECTDRDGQVLLAYLFIYPLLRTVQPAELNMTLNALATALEGWLR